MKHDSLVRLILAALFAALSCVATMLVQIPIPATGGYVNLGDGVVLLGAFLLGAVPGFCAGALGSMLADILLGYAVYAPGTFAIKGLTALTAAFIYRAGRRTLTAPVLAAVAGEAVMVLGYFAYESLALGYGLAAAASVPANAVQGAVGALAAVCIFRALAHVPGINKFSHG